jgi:hypothetical protein
VFYDLCRTRNVAYITVMQPALSRLVIVIQALITSKLCGYVINDSYTYRVSGFFCNPNSSFSNRSKTSSRKECAITIANWLLQTDERRDDALLPCGSQCLLCHGHAGVTGATNWQCGSISRALGRQVQRTMDPRVAWVCHYTETHCPQWRSMWWISLCCTIAWLISRDHCMSLWHNMKRPLSILGYNPRLFLGGLRKFIDKFSSHSIVFGYQPHHFAPDDGNRKRLRNAVLLFRIVASFYNHSYDRQQLIFKTGNFWTYFCDVWKPEMGLKLSSSGLWRCIVWYMGTKLNVFKSQKTIIMIFTAVRASTHTFYCSK